VRMSQTRNAKVGTRNIMATLAARPDLALLFRVPRSHFRVR